MRTTVALASNEIAIRLCVASMATAQFFVDGAPVGSLVEFMEDLDHRTFYARGHSLRVATIAAQIHETLGASRDLMTRRYFGALLHDVGKAGIPADILSKPGPLTAEEFEVVKTHAAMGADVVTAVAGLDDLVGEIRHHHERVDGGGYPDGLEGSAIPLAARVLAIADSFDAMTSDRVYRPAFAQDEAIEELRRSSGTQFDGEIVEAFIATLV